MKLINLCFSALLAAALMAACGDDPKEEKPPVKPNEPVIEVPVEVGPPEGKEVYIPQELSSMKLTDSSSQWYWGRTKSTDDVILFWAKGFGDDLSKAPNLQGENMKVDADNLLKKVQEFYDFYYDKLGFVRPGSTKADKYRMMVMLDYSLEGTAYGGTYDNEIGTLWVSPNRVQDKKMNTVAHELGHCFQLQLIADGDGVAWGGCGFYEMTSQWMLWQVNPDWQTDEYYHLEAFRDLTHKAFLHIENIYHSPYIIELWAEKHGLTFIADLFREGKTSEDPVITYKRITGVSQEEFNDEMWHNYARLINWDIDRVRENARPYRNKWDTRLLDAGDGWKRVAVENAPENYGFNAISLSVPEKGHKLTLDFRGEAGKAGYISKNVSKAGWRYGLVAVDKNGNTYYGDMKSAAEGSIEYETPADKNITNLWLVVMGAPTEHWRNNDNSTTGSDAQWPYSFKMQIK